MILKLKMYWLNQAQTNLEVNWFSTVVSGLNVYLVDIQAPKLQVDLRQTDCLFSE